MRAAFGAPVLDGKPCIASLQMLTASRYPTDITIRGVDRRSIPLSSATRQGLIGPLSKRREAALRETAPVTASGFTRPRCRVQAETSRRSRLSFHTTITTKQQPRKSTQRRDISKATSADPQADIGADPEAESEGCSAPLSADSPQHLFAAARAAALQAGEDQQSAKFSAAIAADAASVAASTAGLARASAHDAAVAAERAATWAADAADELAEAAAASEDLVLKLYELQTAGGPKAKQSAVKALLTAAQAAAKAADTLKQSLADAAPQTVRHTSASAAQRSPPAPPAATADSFDGPARAAQLQTDQETISEQHMNGSKPPSASSSVADADPGGSAPRSEAAATRQRLEGSETMSASLDAAAAVQSTATATIGPASETANESTEEPIDDAIVEPADEASKDATVQRDDETAVEPTEEPTDDADLEAADEPTADATFDTNPESAVEPAEANLESAVEPAEDLSEVTRKDKVMMQRALQLARRGVSFTEPNPAVGCVILSRSGKIVGEGFHPAAGQPHAEVYALRGAGQAAEGGTAYVTLEPCNHYGRTPPCALALVDARVARVVVGVQDPNPLVAGAGMQTLRDAGIAVAGPCEETACWEVNREFMEMMAAAAAKSTT